MLAGRLNSHLSSLGGLNSARRLLRAHSLPRHLAQSEGIDDERLRLLAASTPGAGNVPSTVRAQEQSPERSPGQFGIRERCSSFRPPRCAGSNGLGHTARVAAGIIGCRLDGGWWKWLWCVRKQLCWIVGHRLVRIDHRVRLRKWRDHALSQPAGRAVRRSLHVLCQTIKGVDVWVGFGSGWNVAAAAEAGGQPVGPGTTQHYGGALPELSADVHNTVVEMD